MFSAGDIIRIQDTVPDGRITEEEFNEQMENRPLENGDVIEVGSQRFTYEGNTDDELREFLARIRGNIADAASAPDVSEAREQFNVLRGRMAETHDALRQAQEQLQQLQQNPEANQEAIQRVQERIEYLQNLLQNQINQAQTLNRTLGREASAGIDSAYYEETGIEQPGDRGRNTAAMTLGGQNGQPRAQTARSTGFTPPANWGAQTAMPQFNSDAFMQSMTMEDNILSSYDQVMQSTSRGRQLMMLFFQFAKMAESGDMGAMYQFMKFITYIISKDKAKQQIDMGKKLIELQDTSRKYTDLLMNQQTNANDPNSSNEFMKTMTLVKSETDSIATSQKLISNMMEEMAMVVENLTGVTKGALDSYGRILRTVARMGG